MGGECGEITPERRLVAGQLGYTTDQDVRKPGIIGHFLEQSDEIRMCARFERGNLSGPHRGLAKNKGVVVRGSKKDDGHDGGELADPREPTFAKDLWRLEIELGDSDSHVSDICEGQCKLHYVKYCISTG